MEDLSKDLFGLIKALANENIDFVICGGIACVLHGVERATYDIDLSVSFDKTNLEKIVGIAKRFNLIPRIPEPVEHLYDEEKRKIWVEKKGALLYTFVSRDSPLQMDIFLSYPLSFETLHINSEEISIDDVKIKISSVKDLLVAKNSINPLREKDLTDIKELEKIYEQKNKSPEQ